MRRWLTRKQSVADRVPLPRPLSWALLTVALLAAAVAAFVLARGTVLEGAPAWIRMVITPDGAGVFVPALLVLVAVLAFRRTLLARLARKPGPVEITAFTGAPAAGGPTGEDVLADFRRTLTTMNLSSPLSVPSSPSADSVLDEVRTAVDNTKNSIATSAALVRAVIQVRYAYRVSAQLRNRGGPQPRGITVSVLLLPGGHGEIETFWSDDWADVAERAAHFVGAFILPRSRLARRPSWTAWRGLDVPPDLFHHSQLARRHLRDRQYDQALAAFHRALEIDPQNPYLRIEVGQAQEQLGLFMDAVVTYADVVAIESWYDRRLWLRLQTLLGDHAGGPPPSWLERSPNGPEALLIARYRLVCRLAAADQLTTQWRGKTAEQAIADARSRGVVARNLFRKAERGPLRTRLAVWLQPYIDKYCVEFRIEHPAGSVDEFAGSHSRMRHFLQYVASCEAASLIDDYRWSRGRRRPGMPVTQTALNVLRVWAPLYLDQATAKLSATAMRWATASASLRPPLAAELDRRLSGILRRKPARSREWQEYYNAACTFAVALGEWPVHPDAEPAVEADRRQLVLCGVRHLQRAVSCTDSSYVGTYAQWLSTGDQDLNPLRSKPAFIDFLDRYLPNDEPRVPRPGDLVPVILSMHTIRLLQQYARRRTEYWNAQLHAGTDIPAVREELDRELTVRALAREFALDDRDWRRRSALIDETDDFVRRCGLAACGSALPRFQDDPETRRYRRILDRRLPADTEPQHPDDYFREVVQRRDDHWQEVLRLLPDNSAAARQSSPRLSGASALRFWHRLDTSLSKALYGADCVVPTGPPIAAALARRKFRSF